MVESTSAHKSEEQNTQITAAHYTKKNFHSLTGEAIITRLSQFRLQRNITQEITLNQSKISLWDAANT